MKILHTKKLMGKNYHIAKALSSHSLEERIFFIDLAKTYILEPEEEKILDILKREEFSFVDIFQEVGRDWAVVAMDLVNTVDREELKMSEKDTPIENNDRFYFTLIMPNGREYNIPKNQCSTDKELCRWIEHIREKNWVTHETITHLMNEYKKEKKQKIFQVPLE